MPSLMTAILAAGLLALGSLAGARENATLNFEDAELSAVIATVSEITGRNFIVDPRVKGKVTVLSPTPLSPDGVYQAFLSILQVHGFAAVPVGNMIKIVPDTDAKQVGVDLGRDRYGNDEIITRVIQIENVSATQLVPILRPLIPQYGHLAAYAPSNMLIVSDRAANVQRIEALVRRMDQATDRDIEVVKLEYATAAEVVRLVTNLSQEAKKADPTAPTASVVADERTNSLLIGGDRSQRLAIRALIAQLDTQTDLEGNTQVIYLRYAEAEQLAPVLAGYAAQASGKSSSSSSTSTGTGPSSPTASVSAPSISTGGSGETEYRIIPEPGTNALVITAPPKVLRSLRTVIQQLDIRRAQVLVEAVIAEVSENKSRELGIDTAVFKEGNVAAASILSQDTLSALAAVAAGTPPVSAAQLGATLLGGGESGGYNYALLLRALAGDGKTNILSTPTLVTLDNEEAEISVGQEVPFITGNFTNTGTGTAGAVNPFQTVERKDVGLKLKITPQINEGDTVQLKISQEVSSLSASSTSAVDLITNKRTLNTSVIVGTNDVLVLGGLIDDNVIESNSKIPVLGDIPLFGALFRNRSVTKDKRNLMIFIQPRILREDEVADYYTRRKYNYMRSQELEEVRRGVPMLGSKQVPVMPPYEMREDAPLPTLYPKGAVPAEPQAPAPKAKENEAPASPP
jgi:general secretion pathway protein D